MVFISFWSMFFLSQENTCLIDEKCYAAGELFPHHRPLKCDPELNATSWTECTSRILASIFL